MVSYPPPPLANKFIVLADGENLVFRYQDLLNAGRKPNSNVVHIQDVLVWHPSVTAVQGWSALRVNYYTSAVAAEDRIAELEQQIAKISVNRYREIHTQVC